MESLMDIDRLKRFISYDPDTGAMTWRERKPEDFLGEATRTAEMRARMFNERYAGRPALSSMNAGGYLAGRFDFASVTAHRAAWAIHTGAVPSGQIDHINGNRADNRIANLRDVPRSINGKNQKRQPSNKSGVSGVRYERRRKRWAADIRHNGRLFFLGRFKCFADAVRARKSAERKFNFHPNHGRP